jgi:hypothetical protein
VSAEQTREELLEIEAREYSHTRLYPEYLLWRDLVDAMAERDRRNGCVRKGNWFMQWMRRLGERVSK